MTPYKVTNLVKLDDWLENHSEDGDPIRGRVLRTIMDIANNPESVDAQPVPNIGLPVYSKLVPGTNTIVSFVLIKHPPYPESVRSVRLVDERE